MQIHQYARCYILALLGDKLFMDKSGDRVHLMFLAFLHDLRDPPQYSWGSGCLAGCTRELCRASEKGASQIGGACTLVQYWAWARLPFLCPRIEPPPGCDYGPWPYAPLAFKWVRVPSSKSRPSGMALIHYREQLVRIQPDQIVWQPYEADFGHLPDFCVAGRDTWTARVPLVCFCIVEIHHPDRVLRQFGLAQEQPDHVVYDERLHRIDLRGKVEKNWREEHGPYILTWDARQQRLCHAPPQTGEMPRDHDYYRWYRPVTRKYVDRNSAKLDIAIESHLALLEMLLVGSRAHNHVRRILNDRRAWWWSAPNGEANNGHED
ncbi:serine/threonine-protein phosphatase 7 long form homolog [Castanea sativa]|uniref:serine/threonine-protein phosphatase 7 long form homolog n=1 Tax=Castanea sativa TaxID=21020 RepID=UPI003F64A3BD